MLAGCSGPTRPAPGEGRDSGVDAEADAEPADSGVDAGPPSCADPFEGGTLLGTVPLLSAGTAPLETLSGAGLDGRLYTDLSTLTPETLVTPNDQFYVRTRMPDRIDLATPWRIRAAGLIGSPREIGLDELEPLVAPMPTTLLECSGNGDFAHFGMLSAAEWDGVPMTRALELLDVRPEATRVLVSGFDQHSQPSERSTPGASWVFTFDDLERYGAFLATRMNGAPLPPDHGFPVRLVVPRWYGCTCVKWVDEIRLVDDAEPATDQMREFASRTHQDGVPELARDYLPATIDQAAMAVRVEKWRVGGALLYRVVGVMWGGYEVTDALVIAFRGTDPFVPVDVCPAQATNQTWTLWSHAFRPPASGTYDIELRIDDPSIPTRRLDARFYVRSVTIDEV